MFAASMTLDEITLGQRKTARLTLHLTHRKSSRSRVVPSVAAATDNQDSENINKTRKRAIAKALQLEGPVSYTHLTLPTKRIV